MSPAAMSPAAMSAEVLLNQAALCGFFAMMLYAAWHDAASFRIPNLASLVIVALYPLHALASPVPVHWAWALLVAAAVFGVGLALFERGWVGGGDVKFLSAASLWAGSALLMPFLLVTALAGGALAMGAVLLQRVRRFRTEGAGGMLAPGPIDTSQKIPYGVAIAGGGFYVGFRILMDLAAGGTSH